LRSILLNLNNPMLILVRSLFISYSRPYVKKNQLLDSLSYLVSIELSTEKKENRRVQIEEMNRESTMLWLPYFKRLHTHSSLYNHVFSFDELRRDLTDI